MLKKSYQAVKPELTRPLMWDGLSVAPNFLL